MIYCQTLDPHTPLPTYDAVQSYCVVMPSSGDATDVYLPAHLAPGQTTLPVALLLQGGRVDKRYYRMFATAVARYGFIVLVPNHMNTFSFYPGNVTEGLFSEMQQIPDTLAYTAAQHDNASSPLYRLVDTERMVLLGHSYGAACAIGALQEQCEYPFCEEGATFTLPAAVKCAALCGINTSPRGKPLDRAISPTYNNGLPLAFVNGARDNNARYLESIISYARIQDPPKALVFINGANHYAMCDQNNPPGPGEDPNPPLLSQEESAAISARWCALFCRAHALQDQVALTYVNRTGRYLDPDIELFIQDAGVTDQP